jgi:NitT/TauT family transport system substrate-binding protein
MNGTLIGLMGLMMALTSSAEAADVVRVGAAAQAYSFSPIEVGVAAGIYQKLGLDVQKLEFSGAAKLNTGMLADAADIGVTGATDFAFQVKGTPAKTVGAIVVKPVNMGISVGDTIKTVADLKGKKFGVTQTGTLTYWMALELARTQGWPASSVTAVPVGGVLATQVASLLTGQVDCIVSDVAVGLTLAEQKRGRVLLTAQDYAPGLVANSIIATDQLIKSNPDVLKRFLKGWYETVAFMATHKDAAVKGGIAATGLAPSVVEDEYDTQKVMWSLDGTISPAELDQLARAIFEIGLVDAKPDLSQYYDPKFLPQG